MILPREDTAFSVRTGGIEARGNVSFGSSTDLAAPKFDFRSSPESGLKSDIGPCPFGANTGSLHRLLDCQSAFKFDPSSASNFDPFERAGFAVALGSSELAGIAETRRARVA
jgi:hypothetical protein